MKIHVAFEFESVEEMLDTLGQRTNQVTQAMKTFPEKPLEYPKLVKQEPEPDADEDETEEKAAPKRRGTKKAAKKTARKVAPPVEEEEETEEEEEETPRAKKAARHGGLHDLLDPADDDEEEEEEEEDADTTDENEDEEEAPRPKKSAKLDRAPQKTLEDVREACRAFAKKHGPDVLSDVLTEKFDIEALDDLTPKQYNEAIATLLFYEVNPKKGGK